MSKRVPSTKEQLLGRRLRREAMASRPAFSESLHQRIACAVRRRRAADIAVAGRATVARRWRRGLSAVLAAACLLVAATIGWRLHDDARRPSTIDNPPSVAEASIADLPSIDELAGHASVGLDGLMASVELTHQTAQLEHDARLAAHTILERLPIDLELVEP